MPVKVYFFDLVFFLAFFAFFAFFAMTALRVGAGESGLYPHIVDFANDTRDSSKLDAAATQLSIEMIAWIWLEAAAIRPS